MRGRAFDKHVVSIIDPENRILKDRRTGCQYVKASIVSIIDPENRILKVAGKGTQPNRASAVSIIDPENRILKGHGDERTGEPTTRLNHRSGE